MLSVSITMVKKTTLGQYMKMVGIFEAEGSFLGSKKVDGHYVVTIDADKSKQFLKIMKTRSLPKGTSDDKV